MWKQLVYPNVNIPYYGGLCEGFVEGTVGQATLPFIKNGTYTTTGVYPTATKAWEQLPGKHIRELPPKGVRVVVYFSLGSTSAGHTAISLEDGRVASSTSPGYNTSAYIHPNLNNLIDVYARANNGCQYLGWSEYIGKAKVVEYNEEENMATRDSIIRLFQLAIHRNPSEEDIKARLPFTNDQIAQELLKSGEWLGQNHEIIVAYPQAVKDILDLKKQLADKGQSEAEKKLQSIKDALK